MGEIAAAEGLEKFRLRVSVQGGGCAGFNQLLFFDEEQMEDGVSIALGPDDPVKDTDIKIETNGICLIVDQMSMMYLRGTTINYIATLAATGFKFDNPNVSSTCGCGSSFSV